MQTVLEAFEYAAMDRIGHNDRNYCFICYTIKGHGLQIRGHPDNHGLFLNAKQGKQPTKHLL